MIIDEQQAIADFKLRAVEMARALPAREARQFLKGLLLCATGDVNDIRAAYTSLCSFDDQLELIADRQLNFRDLLKS